MTADVLSWLTATLDEVERENTRRDDGGWPTGSYHAMDCAYGQIEFASDDCGCGRPAWALASVEADRAILAEHGRSSWKLAWSGTPTNTCTCCGDDGCVDWPCRTVLLVASRYRHRPGWQKEWAPS